MSNFIERFNGRFNGIMNLEECFEFFNNLKSNPCDWYLYDTDKSPSVETLSKESFIQSIEEIKNIIKTDHSESYCGLVYVDDLNNPEFFKIFHPKNMGKTCGGSDNPPLPRWVFSKTLPENLEIKQEEEGFLNKLFKL